jgi:hypothetical protein
MWIRWIRIRIRNTANKFYKKNICTCTETVLSRQRICTAVSLCEYGTYLARTCTAVVPVMQCIQTVCEFYFLLENEETRPCDGWKIEFHDTYTFFLFFVLFFPRLASRFKVLKSKYDLKRKIEAKVKRTGFFPNFAGSKQIK